ncbi:MAG: GDP-mannose 4,6-dehydratase [Firmicutes bacterium]|nr:GDP-mannose 4,6-dehydratase [Bacillota bacterium]
MGKRALITGITGQDGSYLAELLLEKGYTIFGLIRRSSTTPTERISHLSEKVELVSGDLLDERSLRQILEVCEPDEVYNLAAQSFVPESWNQAILTGEVTALGATRLLNAIIDVNPRIRYYQASTSEMFGKAQTVPQNEATPFYPRSPYGVSKLYAHWITVNYRESYGLFACSGILFNHESPRRGLEFVTRKVTYAAAQIKEGLRQELWLGNLDAQRDWGYAPDYVEGMWRMLQADQPDDYVLATGETHSVREWVDKSFRLLGLDYRDYVKVDTRLVRPAEVDLLIGDASKARQRLGWKPSVTFDKLVEIMVEADLALVQRQQALQHALKSTMAK